MTAYEMRISDWIQTCALPIFPFDNADFRAIKYTWKNPHTTEQALSELKQHIESIDSGARISNPFTRARGVSHLVQTEDKRDDILLGLLDGQNQLNRSIVERKSTRLNSTH